MSVWGQIVAAYVGPVVEEPKPRKLREPITEKQCSACGVVKPRAEFYPRPSHSPNAISQKCKVCYTEHYKKKRREKL